MQGRDWTLRTQILTLVHWRLSLLVIAYNKRFHHTPFQCQTWREQEECQLCELLLLGYKTEWSSIDAITMLTFLQYVSLPVQKAPFDKQSSTALTS